MTSVDLSTRLQGQVVVVTGGGSGIGAATAQRAANEGAAVAILDLNGEAAEKTASALIADSATAVGLSVDVSQRSDWEAAVAKVIEQFGRANGEALDITEDPTPRGHSFEFRINGEDAGRGFLPAPGPVTLFDPPTGPGVRLDSGVETGSVIGGQFDSMLAKLIVTGATRAEALDRSRRALAEFTVEGLATVIPFHRAVVSDPAFIGDDDGFTVHTRWIDTEWDNTVEPFTGGQPPEDAQARVNHVIEVDGKRVSLVVPTALLQNAGGRASASQSNRRPPARVRRGGRTATGTASSDAVTAPMQGTVVKVGRRRGPPGVGG